VGGACRQYRRLGYAGVEMTKPGETIYRGFGDLPDLDPIIAHDEIEDGWRGLTENGEIFEVRGRGGHKAVPPDGNLLIMHAGKALGYRAIQQSNISIDRYMMHFDRAAKLFRSNEVEEAIMEADATIAIAPTVHARYNRAFMLLSVGRWAEGFAEYEACEQGPPFQRPQCKAAIEAGIKPLRLADDAFLGSNQRLLVLHAHGFGDTIMGLRYVAEVRACGIDVLMQVPFELDSLAGQVGPVTDRVEAADYFVPFLMLPYICSTTAPRHVRPNYRLNVDPELAVKWRHELGPKQRKRIGIAWSVGKSYDGDYPRAIPLPQLVDALAGAELHSVQIQEADEAARLGVHTHELADFADCAALMMQMDEIVTVDTAAAHLAGAIEHPKISLLLSHWASWRWLADWYPTMTICRQTVPGDWASALDAMHVAASRKNVAPHRADPRPI
jgi:hypothetical protein